MVSTEVNEIELSIVEESPSNKTAINLDLELVKHLEVSLDAIIGNKKMSVESLYSLKVGEVISLNSHTEEPIKLEVNGQEIGQGILVAVEGNYGIKITRLSEFMGNEDY